MFYLSSAATIPVTGVDSRRPDLLKVMTFCFPVFYSELLDTMVKAKEDNYTTENLILEINSLK
jgi:hypothetical protein